MTPPILPLPLSLPLAKGKMVGVRGGVRWDFHLPIWRHALLVASLLLSGCVWDSKIETKPDAIIGVWRGETGGDRANNCVMELMITRIDAGLICLNRSWPKDPLQGIAGEIRFPLKEASTGTWQGEYHGKDGFGFSDIETVMKVAGNKLEEHRITKTPGDPKVWDNHFVFYRYSK